MDFFFFLIIYVWGSNLKEMLIFFCYYTILWVKSPPQDFRTRYATDIICCKYKRPQEYNIYIWKKQRYYIGT